MLVSTILIVFSYLIGAIPFGYIIVKKYSNINIQEFGSGNIGSTNVKRAIGKKGAILTQLLDILKGLIPTLITLLIVKNGLVKGLPSDITLFASFSTILGHDFTPFLKFRGGKGVNTTMGASLIVTPLSTILAFLIYVIAKKVGKFVSVGSLLIGLSLPLFSFIFYGASSTSLYSLCAGILLILRHRDNIHRLLNRKENL
ncbi:MAG: glycerol-3-phosphate 1-O-acyltransferase PlsY [Bacillota bacterium]|nr:glycerol-3-phosphate 1-O-acyltransferase PlsY [Bacillota bacterium]